MDIQTHDRTARQCRNRQAAGRSGAADGDLGKERRAEQSKAQAVTSNGYAA